MRERGLKYKMCWDKTTWYTRRSREGAWIEMLKLLSLKSAKKSRSREGAWIEMLE